MQFTYDGYRQLIDLLKKKGYDFVGYENYQPYPRCVILRHDIDNSIEKAIRLAELEFELGVHSTYFLLLTSDFYNVASARSQKGIQRIINLKHDIGLHFDEKRYPNAPTSIVSHIQKEVSLLESFIEYPVRSVSMHRPSPKTLSANYQIPGIVNSYSKLFFEEFKYLSDSRRRWREPVMDIVAAATFPRLHILTHAIWYNEKEQSLSKTLWEFITSANGERYQQEKENITNLESIISTI